MDALHGDATSEHDKELLEAIVNKDGNDMHKPKNDLKVEKESSYSSSSSSDTSSEKDFFQLDARELSQSMTGEGETTSISTEPVQHGENVQLETAVVDLSVEHDVAAVIPGEKDPSGLLQSAQEQTGKPISHVSSCTPGPDYVVTPGAKQSPPIQVMGRSDCPDPNRIPAAIFTRMKSTVPMEWSVASNESLFSIHMGKSGDLTNYYNTPLDYSPINTPPGSTPPKVPGVDPKEPQTAEAANAEAMKDVLRAAAEEHAVKDKPKVAGVHHSDSPSALSEGSVTSYSSFAFPILTGEGRNVSLHGESLHQDTQKDPSQQPPPQADPSKEAPNASQQKWFPCFSCCPFCC
ncbi:uncharacterized protein [Typha angustifolia]|uniref:uncharacterized protein n=1 Tax=Typha angustifolia TaxID=59011 RepID=UPI003C2C5919